MTIVRKFLVLLAVLAGLAAVSGAGSASAAPGDTLAQISPVAGCAGVGVGYDGTNILFTCSSDNVVHNTDLTGADNGGVKIIGAGGNTPGFDAIAYDPTEGALYGGDLDGAGSCRIWSADVTGIATLKFSYVDSGPLARCSAFFYDGLTVDTLTNTLWTSPDVNETIHHFNKDGTSAGPDIPFTTLTVGMCPWAQGLGAVGCWNSGLAIGLDGNLFAGTASDGKIVQLDPSVPSILGTFATVGGRDEDLECGPLFTKTDGSTVETILSRDIDGRIDVLEAPAGTCKSPAQEVSHGFMTGGGSVFTRAGARVTHGLELHCTPSDGANNLQVNWHKKKFHLTSLDSASCTDDPAISPSPPDASFDTMTGSGTGKYNGQAGASIEFTFADAGEPGRNDTATMTIKDASSNTVLSVSGVLKNGNHQAHDGS